jgi:hypothetical protein
MFGGELLLPEKYAKYLSLVQNSCLHFGFVFEHIEAKSKAITYLLLAFLIVLYFKNSTYLSEKFKPTKMVLIASVAMFLTSVFMISRVSEFLYFNF